MDNCTIGLIGGLNPEYDTWYYSKLTAEAKTRVILMSVDRSRLEPAVRKHRWKELTELMSEASLALEQVHPDIILLCCDAANNVCTQIEKNISTPILSAARTAAEELRARHIRRVGIIGPDYISHGQVYEQACSSYGLSCSLPNEHEFHLIEQVLHTDLFDGYSQNACQALMKHVFSRFAEEGVQALICTNPEFTLYEHLCPEGISVFSNDLLHVQGCRRYLLTRENVVPA